MDPAVDQVLAERSRRGRAPAVASLVGALALHAAVAAALIIVPRLTPPPPPLEYVDVKVVPAAALGAPRSEPRATPPAPQSPPTPRKPAEPPPPKPAPEAPVLPRSERPAAQKPEKPKPEKPKPAVPDNRIDPTTRPKVVPPPRELLAKRLGAAAAEPQPSDLTPPAAKPAEALPNRPGVPNGSATGTAPVGSSIATLDNPDFTYDYYIAQLLSSIDHNWTRPPVGTGVRAVISFRIQRDGSLSDLTVRESSSFDTFDLAALRAVQNAAPFPPLPRAYRHDSLGVNLIVR
jgi:colicin import membrane protein